MEKRSQINLLEHTVFRRQQLEKIMFAYHNLYRLHPSYTKMVSEAFQTKNSLLLWNFENDCLLNSRELEDLMQQDCTQYSNFGDVNYNGNNLVNSLNARHKPLPLPRISSKKKEKFLMKTGPPPDLLEIASSHPDSTQNMTQMTVQQNYHPTPQTVYVAGPSQPFNFQERPSNHNYERRSSSMNYQAQSSKMQPSVNTLPPPNMQVQSQHPCYLPAPVNPENMVFPNSGQGVYCPPPQAYQGVLQQMPSGNMSMQTQQYYPPPQMPQLAPNQYSAYYGPPPPPQMIPMMASGSTYNQQATPQMPPQINQMMPSQPVYPQQAPPINPTMYSTDEGHRQTYEQPPAYQQNSMSCLPPPVITNPDGSAGYLVPYVPAPAEQVNFQPSGQTIDQNHPDIVYDTAGYAYQKMIVTTTCLVPIQQYTTSANIPGQTDIEETMATNQDVYNQEEVQEQESNDIEKPDDSDTGIEDCGSQTPVHIQEHEGDPVETMESEQEVTLVEESSEDIDDDLVSSSVESEYLAETPTPASEVEDDGPRFDRMDTPIVDVIDKCEVAEKSVEIVNIHHLDSSNQAESFSIALPTLSPHAEGQKTVVMTEVGSNEEVLQAPPATPSSVRKQKLTKKQKRMQAAEKAKELETDDAILEEALKSKKEYLAANGLTESVETPASPQKGMKMPNNKKKNRDQMKIIIENVTLSSPAPQLINPQIMHRIKTAIHARARSLEGTGRPTTDPNIYRQKFFEAVVDFEKSFVLKSDDSQQIKEFIEGRIAFFRTLSPALSFSRITIYEHLYVDTPKSLLIEIRFLISLPTDNIKQIVQLEKYEDIFLSLF